jgi:hypothetical protein
MACSSSPSRPLHLNCSAPFPSLSPDMDENRAMPPLHPLLVPLWTRPSRPLQTCHDTLALLLCLLHMPMPPPLHSPTSPRGALVHRSLSPLPPIKGAPEHAFETTPHHPPHLPRQAPFISHSPNRARRSKPSSQSTTLSRQIRRSPDL